MLMPDQHIENMSYSRFASRHGARFLDSIWSVDPLSHAHLWGL